MRVRVRVRARMRMRVRVRVRVHVRVRVRVRVRACMWIWVFLCECINKLTYHTLIYTKGIIHLLPRIFPSIFSFPPFAAVITQTRLLFNLDWQCFVKL